MLHSQLRFAGFQRTTEMERGPVRPERRLHVVENVRRMRRSPFPSLLRGFFFRSHGPGLWEKLEKIEKAQSVPVLGPSHVAPTNGLIRCVYMHKTFQDPLSSREFQICCSDGRWKWNSRLCKVILLRSLITCFVLPPPHYTQKLGVMIRNCYFQLILNLIEERRNKTRKSC